MAMTDSLQAFVENLILGRSTLTARVGMSPLCTWLTMIKARISL